MAVPSTLPYRMQENQQLSVIFASVCLGKTFPIIGIDKKDEQAAYVRLHKWGLITEPQGGNCELSRFGKLVRGYSLEVRDGMVIAICAKFG